jgi:hypothetical protein
MTGKETVMANNYTQGTGAFVFDGEPVLSPVSKILMDHVRQYDHKSGFYLEEGSYVQPEDVAVSLIDYALSLIKDEVSSRTLKQKLVKARNECEGYKEKAFQILPILLREAGVAVNETLAQAIREQTTHPIEYVLAIVNDKDSNLLSVSYEEAHTCSKMRPGEFGGAGYYYSRNVNFVSSSQHAFYYGGNLDTALVKSDMHEIRKIVSRQLAHVVDAIRDPDIRTREARNLLAGDALLVIEKRDETKPVPGNLGEKLFTEILDNVETVTSIGEEYGMATLVDLMYLLQVLAKHQPGAKDYIEQTLDSRVIEFLGTLPNGADYIKFVSTAFNEEIKETA